ncbi:MAG: thiol-disulfide oxidoreductase DCC family protein [Candidatus Nitronauta litoralis]|uniref:Thiol-disulfide oxidoreductase DCC family protein n=1 Tax=Candidatus Nitronauta litoralis TaxID=2705533 RepID=A0A7T0BWU5_9BACT|nr:MAG: thiol-disulfide oxidoreductase DCC family protein [Candidatus Nitronauta litoralis]
MDAHNKSSKNEKESEGSIILFDGVCNLCNGTVNFIVDRDPDLQFRMASLQSEAGQHFLDQYNLPKDDFETIVLIEDGQVFTHSTSILRITKKLSGLWPVFSIFLLVPKPIRDWCYRWVSTNRYRWFGKEETCRIPTPEMAHRFLD